MTYTTIRDLAQALATSAPDVDSMIGLDGIEQVVRENRHLFCCYEHVDADTYRALLAACYVACGVSEREAEQLVSE